MKQPTHLGHVDAATLEAVVTRGDMLGVELGRVVKHLRDPGGGRRGLIHRYGLRLAYAACARCGVFGKVRYVVGGPGAWEARCSAACLKESA